VSVPQTICTATNAMLSLQESQKPENEWLLKQNPGEFFSEKHRPALTDELPTVM
jgi:hypothetical protein